MQMIAEIYGILRDGLGMSAAEIGDVFAEWNKGRLNSYLIEITAKVLAATDPMTGKPMVDVILDTAGQKGTGKLVGRSKPRTWACPPPRSKRPLPARSHLLA